uniref:Uncharacterized protein n=1 Tax=Oryza meridionalis TaxID=40149 RepID=A0A0E0FB65_9ORYZ
MSLADCYSIVMELIEHPQKYGLKLVTMQANSHGKRVLRHFSQHAQRLDAMQTPSYSLAAGNHILAFDQD